MQAKQDEMQQTHIEMGVGRDETLQRQDEMRQGHIETRERQGEIL